MNLKQQNTAMSFFILLVVLIALPIVFVIMRAGAKLDEANLKYYQGQMKECERKKGILKFHRNGDYLGCDVPTRKD